MTTSENRERIVEEKANDRKEKEVIRNPAQVENEGIEKEEKEKKQKKEGKELVENSQIQKDENKEKMLLKSN